MRVYTRRMVVAVTERDVVNIYAAAELLDITGGELMRLAIREKVARALLPPGAPEFAAWTADERPPAAPKRKPKPGLLRSQMTPEQIERERERDRKRKRAEYARKHDRAQVTA